MPELRTLLCYHFNCYNIDQIESFTHSFNLLCLSSSFEINEMHLKPYRNLQSGAVVFVVAIMLQRLYSRISIDGHLYLTDTSKQQTNIFVQNTV